MASELSKADYAEIKRGETFDFLADFDVATLSEEQWEAALSELVRVYCEYRLKVAGRRFYIDREGRFKTHIKMLDRGRQAIELMLLSGIEPLAILKRIGDPSAWAKVDYVPWNMYTSESMISSATPIRWKRSKKHSYAQATFSHGLRPRLVSKFGIDTITALAPDDKALAGLVALAESLKVDSSTWIPPRKREVVSWLAKEA